MSYEGLHFALDAGPAQTLRRLCADDVTLRSVVRELVVRGEDQFSCDWYWETIRRCLSGGELDDDPRWRPLADAVLGGAVLYDRPGHVVRIVRLLPADDVVQTATALSGVSAEWLRERFGALHRLSYPGPMQPGEERWFANVHERFTGLADFFVAAARRGRSVLFVVAHLRWRPPREEGGPDDRFLVRRPFRPADYTVDPNSVRSLPKDGGDMPFEWELDDRDGALHGAWREVRRFRRGGRTWVRLGHGSNDEYYIDVEEADGRIGRIECVDPLVAYWEARQTDRHPVRLEDW